MNRSQLRGVLIASSFLALHAWALSAQVAGATVTGTITDPSGLVIPNARIVITNNQTSVVRSVVANLFGFYSAPNLVPGVYLVAASAPGFAPRGTNLTLSVGDELSFPLSLAVGAVDQRVEIVVTPPALDFTSSALSATVGGVTLRDLPLNGRSWTDLATLQPGVLAISTQVHFDQGALRGNRGFGAQISISGGRPTQNNYRLDGISINDYANGGPGSVLGINLGVDALAEFTVITSNYSAEYGKTSGGVVNASTRTGTNLFHASAYSFFRNSALDARNYFDAASSPPPFSRFQYGGSAGGPIWKQHTFFFADFEAIRQALATTASVNVLSNAARVRVTDPAVLQYIALFPEANTNAASATDIAQYTFIKQENATEDFVTGRIDHKLSPRDDLFATYFFDYAPFTIGDAQNLVLVSSRTRRQALVLEHNHSFSSSFINSVRFGLNRQAVANNQGIEALNPLAADTSLGILPGRTAPGVSVPGLDNLVGGVGASNNFSSASPPSRATTTPFLPAEPTRSDSASPSNACRTTSSPSPVPTASSASKIPPRCSPTRRATSRPASPAL